MNIFPESDGNTPLNGEEHDGLIPPHLSTRAELNQWEASNIASAQEWAATRTIDALDDATLRELHRRMFDETWDWAGQYRRSEKNVSPYHWSEVPRLVRDLSDDIRVQYEGSDKTPGELDAIAVRFHHGLVRIHPWPNGNGRHARLATDLLLRHWGRPPFSWGVADLTNQGDVRNRYISALRQADAGSFADLTAFVRS